MSLESLFHAIEIAVGWPTIGWMIAGLLLGIVLGAMPGLGAAMGMAIILPFTLGLDGVTALILLVSIYSGALYGGSIAAILINAPGTPAAAATTFDGYPMSKNGEAKTALAMSAASSAFGGSVTIIALFILSPVLVSLVLLFGTPEYFLMAFLGIVMITVVARGSMVKGLVAGLFGLSLTTVGIAPMTPQQRYTFDSVLLYDGFSFIAGLIGIFAVGEMIKLASDQGSIARTDLEMTGSIGSGVKTVLSKPLLLVKSSSIGMAIGAIPGAGASVSTFIAYAEAVRSDASPELFGSGYSAGIISAESANNGTAGGSLVPTLAFGIPGSGSTAVLLGGLVMHGLRPGPDLFTSELFVTYSLLVALLIGNVVIFLIGTTLVTRSSYLTRIDTNLIIPVVIVLATLGAFSLRSNWIDAFSVIAFGILGYYLKRYDYSIIAFVLGLVLGEIAESNLFRSFELSGGSPTIFFYQPLSLLLVMAIVVLLFSPIISAVRDS